MMVMMILAALLAPACRPVATPRAPQTAAEPAVFPSVEPGQSWTTRAHFQHLTFQNPVFAVMPPRNGGVWFIGEREGRIYSVPDDEQTRDKRLALDLSAQTLGWQDCGLLNMLFHPEFGKAGSPNRGYVYVWYNHTATPHPGPDHPFHGHPSANRLTRFTVPDGARAIDPASALVLIEQPRNNTDHHGGGMFFHPGDGFLYLGVGDGGHPLVENSPVFAVQPADNPQHTDGELLSGVLRIDVDRRGGAISHPIRRQPRNGRTQGYFVPNDNPWVDPNGGTLEEFYAIGLRNPHRMTHDPGSGRTFLGDVGGGKWEEIDVLDRAGLNFQWNYLEAAENNRPRPARVVGVERGPLHSYPHHTFAAVIGGFVYRGQAYPELQGQYLFGDNGTGRIWTLDARASAPAAVTQLLRLPQEMAAYGGLSSFATDARGEPYLLVLGDNQHGTGTLRRLVRAPQPERPMPATLSATRLFEDLATLRPSPALFPYEVNAPFWSDHKQKQRWLSVPSGARVVFRPEGQWTFPPGTVAVKHFDLAWVERDTGKRRRLETRVVVMDAQGAAYGRTYKWRDDQRDADLVNEPIIERLTRVSRTPFGEVKGSTLGGPAGGSLREDGGALVLVSPPSGTLFAHGPAEGDFDVAIELRAHEGATAGLMLRRGLTPRDRSLLVAPQGHRWLRAARAGKTLRLYGGEDGQRWSELPGGHDDASWIRVVGAAVTGADAGARAAVGRATISVPVRVDVRDHFYPSGDQCMACHNASAQYVLGASTRQWNRLLTAADATSQNQLVLASQRGLLDTTIAPEQPAGWKRLVAIDDTSATLQDRMRSYLDANCSQCHRPGNVVQVAIDARYDTPFEKQGLVGALVRWPRSPKSHQRIVLPGDPKASRLHFRLSNGTMPPLGSLIRNREAIDLVREWIAGLKSR
jgi:glucose/arabinose dehydrogenase